MRVLIPLALLGSFVFCSASSDDAHSFEWAGLFHVEDYDKITWLAQKVDGDYIDPSMMIAIIASDGEEEADLEAAEEAFESGIDSTFESGSCPDQLVTSSTPMTTSSSSCYKLQFDTTTYQSMYEIDVTGVNFISVFAEHHPVEFEDTTHYLRAADGTDIEPEHEIPEASSTSSDDEEKKWTIVLLTCIAVNLATFSGVVFLAFKLKPDFVNQHPEFTCVFFASAAGAIIACAIFLIIGEANHILGAAFTEEADATAVWGTAILAGMLCPYLFVALSPFNNLLASDAATESKAIEMTGTIGAEGDSSEVVVATTAKKSQSLLLAICFGDFAHNLVDGFAIGIAFKLCTNKVAWGIFGATLYHEILQELADYVMLTSDAVGLSVTSALAVNFIAGTSIVAGGVIATAMDVGRKTEGTLLAFAGGTYLYLGASEALPYAFGLYSKLDLQSGSTVRKHYLKCLAAFAIGAIGIGLVLLDHEHCVPETDDADASGGHGH